MTEVTWTHPFVHVVLNKIPKDADSLLDVGCGRGIVGALTRIYRNVSGRLVGVDIWMDYLRFCRHFDLYKEVFAWDLREGRLPFGDKEFDVATCLEALEHLPKDRGWKLLHELGRVATRVIVTVPTHVHRQRAFDGNPYQQHASAWSVADFRRLGYSVEGFGDFMVHGRRLRYLSPLLAFLVKKRLPHFSKFLIATKDASTKLERSVEESVAKV